MRAMQNSPDDFEGVKAYVNPQPLSAHAFVEGVTKEFGLANPGNVDLFSYHLKRLTGYAVSQLRASDLGPAVKMPTLLVQVHKDFRTTTTDIEEIYESLGSDDKKLMWIETETESLEGYNYFAKNPKELLAWLDKY
jgi:hypothetical protein